MFNKIKSIGYGKMTRVADFENLSNEIIDIAKTIHNKNWVANHEGNITVKVSQNSYLATPTSFSKRKITKADLILIDSSKNVIEGQRRIFSEIGMHLCVYSARDDVNAVLHAHPPYATALAVCRKPISKPISPEFVVSIGATVPVVDFALHNSNVLEKNISRYVNEFDALLLANHGVLSFGSSLEDAFLRMEHIENHAKLLYIAKTFGTPKQLSDSTIGDLLKMREKAGLGPKGRALKAASSKKEHTKNGDDAIKLLVRKELEKYTS